MKIKELDEKGFLNFLLMWHKRNYDWMLLLTLPQVFGLEQLTCVY